MRMMDLFEDIKDGVHLLSLLEVLSGETLVTLHYYTHILLDPFAFMCSVFPVCAIFLPSVQ